MLTRRLLLVTAGSLLAYGCASPAPSPPSPPPPPGPIPQNILDDLNAILTGLTTILPALSFLPVALLTKVESSVAQAQQLLTEITTANGSGSVSQLIQSFVDVVNQVVSAISGSGNMPSWLSTAIGAIQFLLPIILSFLGVGSRARAAATPGGEAHARAILMSLHPPFAGRGSRLHRR